MNGTALSGQKTVPAGGFPKTQRPDILKELNTPASRMMLALSQTGKHIYLGTATSTAGRRKRQLANRAARKQRAINRHK